MSTELVPESPSKGKATEEAGRIRGSKRRFHPNRLRCALDLKTGFLSTIISYQIHVLADKALGTPPLYEPRLTLSNQTDRRFQGSKLGLPSAGAEPSESSPGSPRYSAQGDHATSRASAADVDHQITAPHEPTGLRLANVLSGFTVAPNCQS